jgi:hypothetical protein
MSLRFLTALQIASGCLLVMGWSSAARMPASTRPETLLFALWLTGAIAAGVAWKLFRQRRLLSGAEFVLNVVGVAFVGLAAWLSSRGID